MNGNKRGQSRKYLIADIKIKKPGSRGVRSAMAINISRVGMGLYTAAPLQKREKIIVRMTILKNGALVSSEEIHGTVRWIKSIGKSFAAGIKFDKEINKTDFPVISRCLNYATTRK